MSSLLAALLLGFSLSAMADDAGTQSAPTTPAESNAPAAADTPASNATRTDSGLTAQQFYQFMLGEVAAQRGQMPLAAAALVQMAQSTHDPEIARLAAEAAIQAREYNAALVATRIWVDAAPDSAPAQQMMVSLAAAFGQLDDVRAHLARSLALDTDENLPGDLMRLNRLLVRIPDKTAVNALVIETTEPYLQLPEAHFARAQAAYNARDMAKAGAEIDTVLSARPDWELAILFKAMLVEGKPADVVAVLQPFVNKYPQAADARLGLARALVGAHRFDDALAQFKVLQSQQPDNPDIIYAVGLLSTQNGDYATAESQFKRLIDMNYPESNLVRVYLGQIAEEKKDDQAAATWYAGVTSGPQYLDAQARAAQLTARAGNVDGAIAMLHKVQATNDDDRVQLVLTEATILREARRYDAAYAVLDKALATRPNDPDLLYEAALDADYLKKFDLSERLWQKLIALKPDSAQAYNAWGYSLADRGVRLDEAQSLIDKALEMRPDDPFILDSKGWVLFRKGDKQAALDLLQRAYKGRPDPEIAAHIGEVLWSLGRQDDARNVLTEAARNYPDNAALADTIKRFMTP